VVIAMLVMIGAGAGIGWLWWHQHQSRLPPGIASGNGRLESDEIDIDTKFAGRIAKLFVDEGDMVAAGQVVAMMDTRDIQASLKKSEALVSQAQRALDEAKANLAQQQTRLRWRSSSWTAPAPSCPRASLPSNFSISVVNR
jgi:HlyD family secretion protein